MGSQRIRHNLVTEHQQIVDSLCCKAKTNTTLKSNYTPIKNNNNNNNNTGLLQDTKDTRHQASHVRGLDLQASLLKSLLLDTFHYYHHDQVTKDLK